MATFAQRAIREPEVQNVQQYRRRVRGLGLAYLGLFVFSLIGIVLILWQAQLLVTLSQRSNVETLTLAFLLVFFVYLVTLSAPGTFGLLRILFYNLRGGSWEAVQQRKARALGTRGASVTAGANVILEVEGRPCEAFQLRVADSAGSQGMIVVDGASLTHETPVANGSSSLLAFFVELVNHRLKAHGARADVQIVQWGSLDDEETAKYLNLVRFSRNLERQLGANELWPKRVLTAEDCHDIERRLALVCASLRDEGFLPHWEYQGKHSLPLIPEPLGLISLSRTEKRVDPLSSMGCAVLIVAAVVIVLAVILLFPPWTPGA